MAGEVPAVHVFVTGQRVDGRDKRRHDDKVPKPYGRPLTRPVRALAPAALIFAGESASDSGTMPIGHMQGGVTLTCEQG